MKILTLIRKVTQEECPWLDRDYESGETVWSYHGAVYGCIGPAGVAVSAKAVESPFFELPSSALKG